MRDPQRAHELTARAAELMESDPEHAADLLRQALAADLFHGPAHNNLGVWHLGSGELYEAAHEFEWARKLLPGHPDPHVNLAITLERAGDTNQAIENYKAALRNRPRYLPAIQGRLILQLGQRTSREGIEEDLRTVALEGTTLAWRDWARRELAKSGFYD